MELKKCTKCGEWKKFDEFHKEKKAKDGLNSTCKECAKEYGKKYYKKNSEKIKKRNRKWREENPERMKELNKIYAEEHFKEKKEYSKEWQKRNPEKMKKYRKKCYEKYKEDRRKYNKEWREKNKEYDKERQRKWRIDNPEKAKLKDTRWKKANPKKVRKTQRKCKKNRLQNDPRFRLRENVSGLINSRLRDRLLSKNGKSTWDFLPYTVDELMQHLEKLFQPGMTWENRNEWHIDHIKPDSLFNYKSIEDKEFQECWALSNLQPLWAEDNLKKSNKY